MKNEMKPLVGILAAKTLNYFLYKVDGAIVKKCQDNPDSQNQVISNWSNLVIRNNKKKWFFMTTTSKKTLLST